MSFPWVPTMVQRGMGCQLGKYSENLRVLVRSVLAVPSAFATKTSMFPPR